MGLYDSQNEVGIPLDAFGRVRSSAPFTLFDSKLVFDAAPTLWDDAQTSGTGTSSTHDKVNARVIMGVAASTAGTRVRQTFRRFNYQPGKSQLLLMTFNLNDGGTGITKRVGLFDDYNGYYLERTSTGSRFVIRKNGLASETFEQANWNSDRVDGTGQSGITLDFSKTQIMWIDFEWLGVGTARFGFVVNGAFILCHQADHANMATTVYTSSPNLPLRYEISNGGTGAAAALDAICSTVISEGGFERTGIPRTVDRGTTPFVTQNDADVYPILGLRLKSSGTHATILPTGMSLVCTSTAAIRYAVIANPTISGDTVVWTDMPDSAVQYANATDTTGVENVVSNGTYLFSGYTQQQNEASVDVRWSGFWGLGTKINGTADELWLCAQRVTGTSETLYASMTFLEQV